MLLPLNWVLTIIFGAFSIVFGLYTVIFGTFSIIFGSNTLIFDDFSIITFGSNTIIVDAFFIMFGAFVVTSHHQSLRGARKAWKTENAFPRSDRPEMEDILIELHLGSLIAQFRRKRIVPSTFWQTSRLSDWVFTRLEIGSSLIYGTRKKNLFDLKLPAFWSKNTRLMTVSVEKVRMAKSRPAKNQSERSYLPQDYLAI